VLRQLSKVIKILGMIKRNFTDRSEETIMSLYKSLVRPYLKFCTPVYEALTWLKIVNRGCAASSYIQLQS